MTEFECANLALRDGETPMIDAPQILKGVVVAKAPATDGRVHASKLDAVEVARTVYRGPYEGLPEAWGELRTWLEASGRKPGERLLEVYLKGPEDSADPKTWETQLNRTLA
jgi:effector-binding domain-containing protein